MDYQRVLFTPENKTIAWAVINKEFCTNAPDDLIYQIQGFICPNRTVVDSWNLTDTTYTIRSDALGKAITYLNITVRNYHQNTDCGNLQNYLLISPNRMFLYMSNISVCYCICKHAEWQKYMFYIYTII